MRIPAPARRLAAPLAIVAGGVLFAGSLGGFASVDAQLQASASPPSVAGTRAADGGRASAVVWHGRTVRAAHARDAAACDGHGAAPRTEIRSGGDRTL